MPDPIMLTEAALTFGAGFVHRPSARCRDGEQFAVLAKMQGLNSGRMDPALMREATEKCAHCQCRKACRNWLRTGVFAYGGDPRCPNAALLCH